MKIHPKADTAGKSWRETSFSYHVMKSVRAQTALFLRGTLSWQIVSPPVPHPSATYWKREPLIGDWRNMNCQNFGVVIENWLIYYPIFVRYWNEQIVTLALVLILETDQQVFCHLLDKILSHILLVLLLLFFLCLFGITIYKERQIRFLIDL